MGESNSGTFSLDDAAFLQGEVNIIEDFLSDPVSSTLTNYSQTQGQNPIISLESRSSGTSSMSNDWDDRDDDISGQETNENYTDQDDDCVIIKIIEKSPASINLKPSDLYQQNFFNKTHQTTGNKLSIDKDHDVEILSGSGSLMSAEKEQPRRNPKRIAKQLNNRRRKLESKFDLSYISSRRIPLKKRKPEKNIKELSNQRDEFIHNKSNEDKKKHIKDSKLCYSQYKQKTERSADCSEELNTSKIRTRSRCLEASEYEPPSPEKNWEWREWPAEGMHERPVYPDSAVTLDESQIQEAAHHALHAVLAFCAIICRQKKNFCRCNKKLSCRKCKSLFTKTSKNSQSCSCDSQQVSDESLAECKKATQNTKFQTIGKDNAEKQDKHELKEIINAQRELSSERNSTHITESQKYSELKEEVGNKLDSASDGSNSSTVSGESGDLIIAENDDNDGEISTKISDDITKAYNSIEDITQILNSYLSPISKLMHIHQRVNSGGQGMQSYKLRGLQTIDNKVENIAAPSLSQTHLANFGNPDSSKPNFVLHEGKTRRPSCHTIRQSTKDEHPDCVSNNESLTVEDLRDLINYTALLYCIVCSVPQEAVAEYINSLNASSALEWLKDMSQNIKRK